MSKCKFFFRATLLTISIVAFILTFISFMYAQNNERVIYSFKKKGIPIKASVISKWKKNYFIYNCYFIKIKCTIKTTPHTLIISKFVTNKIYNNNDYCSNILYIPNTNEAIFAMSTEKKNLSLIDKKTLFNILFIVAFLSLIIYLKTE